MPGIIVQSTFTGVYHGRAYRAPRRADLIILNYTLSLRIVTSAKSPFCTVEEGTVCLGTIILFIICITGYMIL